jgi:hypothetical protein
MQSSETLNLIKIELSVLMWTVTDEHAYGTLAAHEETLLIPTTVCALNG